MTDASSGTKTDPAHNFDSGALEFVQQISEMVANQLLAEPHGQQALKAVHR